MTKTQQGQDAMRLESRELDNGVTQVSLAGQLDIAGANVIEMKFSVLAGSRKKLIADLSEVTFLGSMGLRVLITCATAIARRGGKMALVTPQGDVEKALKVSAIDTVIPMFPSLPEAVAAVSA